MSHQHFCDVAGHWWACNGVALRRGTEPSVCLCGGCRLPVEDGDHSQCKYRVELVACPEHRDGQQGRMELDSAARRSCPFLAWFEEKWSRMEALPDGPEKHALAKEIVEWLSR